MRPYRFFLVLLSLPLLANAVDAEATTPPATPANFEVVERFGPGGDVELTFSWGHVENETEIRFIENEDISHKRRGAWQPITLPSDTIGYSKTVPVRWADSAAYRLKACNEFGCSAKAELLLSETPTLALLLPPTEPQDFSLSLQPNRTFAFSWSDAAVETEYRLLENPDGQSGFTQIATIPADTTVYDLTAFLPARINASYILQACNAQGCSDSDAVFVTVDPSAETIATMVAPSTDLSGMPRDVYSDYSIALDGNTLVVGAPFESGVATGVTGIQDDTAQSAKSGAVWVYVRSTDGRWLLQAYLKADQQDHFGYSVAVDGNTLVVGAPYTDIDEVGSYGSSGAAYLFVRDGTTWEKRGRLKPFNPDPGSQFGYSVALSDDTIVVGAPFNDDGNVGGQSYDDTLEGTAENSGAAYVFVRGGPYGWLPQAYLKADNADPFDHFGYSVAVDGNTLVVGAPREDSEERGSSKYNRGSDNYSLNSGAAYVFERDGMTWSQQRYLKPFYPGPGSEFGFSVALSDDTIVVGAPFNDDGNVGVQSYDDNLEGTAENSGAAYVFVREPHGWWVGQAYLKAHNTDHNDEFGSSVSLFGDTLVVGARFENSAAEGVNGDGSNVPALYDGFRGAAYVFVRNGIEGWGQHAHLKGDASVLGIDFGQSVAISGDFLMVGLPRADGAVHTFWEPEHTYKYFGPHPRASLCSDEKSPTNPNVFLYFQGVGEGSCLQHDQYMQEGRMDELLVLPVQDYAQEPCGCGVR